MPQQHFASGPITLAAAGLVELPSSPSLSGAQLTFELHATFALDIYYQWAHPVVVVVVVGRCNNLARPERVHHDSQIYRALAAIYVLLLWRLASMASARAELGEGSVECEFF